MRMKGSEVGGAAKENLVLLDVLRGLAVLGVVTVHTAGLGLSTSTSSTALAVGAVFASGRLGVEVFFLLSGFLLCSIYEFRVVGTVRYLAARFFRIWPLWMAFSFLWAALYLVEGRSLSSVTMGLVLAAPFLLWISPEHFDSFLPGAWSIQIEVYCYVLFWLFRKKSSKTILMLATVINSIAIFSSFFSYDDWGLFESLRRLTLNTGLNFFVLGWLIARIYRLWKTEGQPSTRVVIKALGHSWKDSAVAVLWLTTFIFSPAIYGNPIEALGFAVLAFLLALAMTRLKTAQTIFAYLGRRSYFVFFSHFAVLYFLGKSNAISFSEPMSLIATPILVILIVGVCTSLAEVSFRFFEAPLMRLARRI